MIEKNFQYITDIIPLEEIKRWDNSSIKIIDATTGSGKSYFIINSLGNYAYENNKKLLFLVNRTILKEQLKKEIPTYLVDTIIVMTYQSVAQNVKREGMDFIKKYDYIICDECHYFFTDSTFNKETDISLNAILESKDSIKIFLSATVYLFNGFLNNLCKRKKLPLPIIYSAKKSINVNTMFYYNDNDSIMKFLAQIPKNEKVIFFCSSIERAYKNSLNFPNGESGFLCSKNSKNTYAKYSQENIRKEIIEKSKFSCRILFTTQMLDNGINIRDRNLKHIIIDIKDFDTVQQCVGRKRFIDKNDKVNIYIEKIKYSTIMGLLKNVQIQKNKINDFKKLNISDFINKYGRDNMNGLIYPYAEKESNEIKYNLNVAMEFKINWDYQHYLLMRKLYNGGDKTPNLTIISFRYSNEIKNKNFTCLEDNIDMTNTRYGLPQFYKVKLFDKDKKRFLDYINTTSITLINKRKKLGIEIINAYFKQNNLPYKIFNKRSKDSETRDEYYWCLEKWNWKNDTLIED